MQNSERLIRWGVLGTARIAAKVGAAIRQADGAELTAIASRSAQRAADWAAEHGAVRSYGSYDALLDDPELDAVYIPLPPALHREWTIKAAECGKHVLCEKPLAMNVAEAEEMAAACREHGVQLMDGVMWLHHPRAVDMLRPIQDGTLGELRRVTSAFTFCWDVIPQNEYRLDREMGGGSLFDLGWYCVGVTLWAFGELPKRVWATARFRNDVDMNLSAVLWYDNDRMAAFECGFDTVLRKWVEVAGTKAALVCDDFTRPWNEDKPRCWIHGPAGKSSEQVSASPIQEVCMIEDFDAIIRSGRLDETWPNRAIATQRVCDALDRAARKECAIEISK